MTLDLITLEIQISMLQGQCRKCEKHSLLQLISKQKHITALHLQIYQSLHSLQLRRRWDSINQHYMISYPPTKIVSRERSFGRQRGMEGLCPMLPSDLHLEPQALIQQREPEPNLIDHAVKSCVRYLKKYYLTFCWAI
jgi:hypothetical protein